MNTFVKDLAERVIASALGGFLAVVSLDGLDILHTDWKGALAAAAGAAIVSVLKGLAARFIGNPSSASLSPKV